MIEFEQKEESIRLLDEHGGSLAAEAREWRSSNPEKRVVGLVLTPDASVSQRITATIEEVIGQELAGRVFVGLVPRDFALLILWSNAFPTLEWLSLDDSLPLLCGTKDGFRLGSVEY